MLSSFLRDGDLNAFLKFTHTSVESKLPSVHTDLRTQVHAPVSSNSLVAYLNDGSLVDIIGGSSHQTNITEVNPTSPLSLFTSNSMLVSNLKKPAKSLPLDVPTITVSPLNETDTMNIAPLSLSSTANIPTSSVLPDKSPLLMNQNEKIYFKDKINKKQKNKTKSESWNINKNIRYFFHK